MRTLTLVLTMFLATPLAGHAQARARPNILVIIADDWSWPHAGIYGDKVVKTPNIDRFARQGMVFHRAYCVSPSCTPSRAAILTGQAIHRLQEGGNLHGILPTQYDCYTDLLERAGYIIGMIGKGWGPGVLEGSGRSRNPAGPKSKSVSDFLKALPADRPFCFWYGSTRPHRPYQLGSGLKAGLDLDAVKVPPCWPDTKEVRSDILDYYVNVMEFDRQVGEVLQALADSGRAENTLVIIISDNGMPFPRSKANLYDLGTHMPLLVCWPERIKPGRESKSFVSFMDIAPTILEAAGQPVPKDMTGRSFLPLFAGDPEQAGRDHVFVERERHANVRRGDLSYPARAVRTDKFLYIKNLRSDRWPAGDPEMYVAVGPFGDIDDGPTKRLILKLQTADASSRRFFELSCGKRPAEELYDLAKDPAELTNVADHPEYAEVKAKLRTQLDRWMTDTADPRADKNGGDNRWDKFPYFGKPGKGKGPPKTSMLRDIPDLLLELGHNASLPKIHAGATIRLGVGLPSDVRWIHASHSNLTGRLAISRAPEPRGENR